MEDKEKTRRELEAKVKRIEDLERQKQLEKAEMERREKEEMLKWAKQSHKVNYFY